MWPATFDVILFYLQRLGRSLLRRHMSILCLLNPIFDELVALDAVRLVVLLQACTVVVAVHDQ